MPSRKLATRIKSVWTRECKETVRAVRAKYQSEVEERKQAAKTAKAALSVDSAWSDDNEESDSTHCSSSASTTCNSGKKRGRKKKCHRAATPLASASTANDKPACDPEYTLKLSMKQETDYPIFGCAFCPYVSGDKYVLATVGGPKICIYSYSGEDKMELIQVYNDEDGKESFYSCVWLFDKAKDNLILAAAGFNGMIKTFSVTGGDWMHTMQAHTCAINDLAGHPILHTVFATASKDFSVRLYDGVNNLCLAIFVGDLAHTDEVLSVDFNLDGSKLITAGMDHAVKIWDLAGNQDIQAAIASAKIYDPTRAKRTFRSAVVSIPEFSNREIHDNYVDCVRSFGNLVISKSCENQMVLWGPNNFKESNVGTIHHGITQLRDYRMRNNTIWFVKFALDFQFERIACGNMTGVIYVWDLTTENVMSAKKHYITDPALSTTIRQVCFSPDGRFICAVTDESTIWVWAKRVPKVEPSDAADFYMC